MPENSDEYVWLDIRDQACERFGDEPGRGLEQRIVAVFEQRPALVVQAIENVTKGWAHGTVRVPWAVVAADSERRLRERKQLGTVRAEDPREKERRLDQALDRIRRGEFATRGELIDGLFGPPRQTASLEVLERIETETRSSPGREMFEAALQAQIRFTREQGRQRIPENRDAPLYPYDTPWLRDRMLAEWRQATLHPVQ
jgi:hypothetical protein